jgi:acetolactate decarboxylase
MKLLFSYLLVIFVTWPIFAQNFEVKSAGELRKILLDADLSTKIRLDTLPHRNLFAIGLVDSLQGEISVIIGKGLISSIKDTYIKTDTSLNYGATLLVYTYVKNWKVITIEQEVNGLEALELLVKRLASENEIDVTKPFPFMVKTWVKNMSCRVIDWQSGILHTPDTHSQFAHELWYSASTIMLAGFYSENHQGIYTNINRKIVAQAITTDPMTSGHLESIETFGKIALYFPDNSGVSKKSFNEDLNLQEY